MCELDEIKGVDIGETYRNEKQVVSFAHYIAKTEKQKLVDQINESKYISVILSPLFIYKFLHKQFLL
jgi:hypothetical protein